MTFIGKISTAANYRFCATVLLSALLLAGCSMDGAEVEDSYVAQTPQERFPIKVAQAPVKLNIDARGGALGAEGMNRIIGFAQDARSNATSRVAVHYASSSAGARKVAQDAVGILVAQGIPRAMISTGSYRGSNAMVTLSFTRKVAVTKECGDWSVNLAGDQFNDPLPNNGCAIQQNMAAMVANPEDFEGPRPMTPVYGNTRSAAIAQVTGDTSSTGGGSQGSNNGTGSSDSSGGGTPAPVQ